MSRIRILLMAFVFLFSGGLLFLQAEKQQSENIPAYKTYPQALGFHGGIISATGLSYQKWMGKHGFQIALGAMYFPPSEDNFNDTTLDYNLGLQYQRRVYGDVFASWLSGQLYLFTGFSHRGYIPYTTRWDNTTEKATSSTGAFTPELNAGFGIGIETIFFEHFSIPVEVGYMGTATLTEKDPSKMFLLQLLPQGGFRYRY